MRLVKDACQWLDDGGFGCRDSTTVVGTTERERRDSATLEERVDELDQQIRILQRLRELAADSVAAAAKTRPPGARPARTASASSRRTASTPCASEGTSRPTGVSTRAVEVPGSTDNLLLRRARPILEATVGRYFDFRLHARLRRHLAGDLRRLLGRQVRPRVHGPGRASSSRRSVSSGCSRPPTSASPSAACRPTWCPAAIIGLQVAGDISEGVLAYQVGRLQRRPRPRQRRRRPERCQGLRGSRLRAAVQERDAPRPRRRRRREHRHGARHARQHRASPVSYAGPAGLFRYRSRRRDAGQQRLRQRQARSSVAAGLLLHRPARPPRRVRHLPQRSHPERRRPRELEHKAWQATGSFFLTGEKAGFRSPAPKRPFDLKEGGFGAIELVARYGELTPDEASFPVFANPTQSVTKAKAWASV